MPVTRGRNGRSQEQQPNAASSKKEVKKDAKPRKAPAKAAPVVEAPEAPELIKEEIKAAPKSRATRTTKAAPAKKKQEVETPVAETEVEEVLDAAPVEEDVAPARLPRGTRATRASAAKVSPKAPIPKARAQTAKGKATVALSEPAAPAARSTRRGKAAVSTVETEVEEEAEENTASTASKTEEEPTEIVPVKEAPARKSRSTRAHKDDKPEVQAVEDVKAQPKEKAKGKATTRAAKSQKEEAQVIGVPEMASVEPEEDPAPASRTRATRGTKQPAAPVAKEAPVKTRGTGRTRGAVKATVEEEAPVVASEEPVEAPKPAGRKRKAREPTPVEEPVQQESVEAASSEHEEESSEAVETSTRSARGAKRRAVTKENKPKDVPAHSIDVVIEETIQQTCDMEDVTTETSPAEEEIAAAEQEQPSREPTPEPTLLFADATSPLLERVVPEVQPAKESEPSSCSKAQVPTTLFDSPALARLATPAPKLHQSMVMSAKHSVYQQDSFDDVLEEGPAFSLSMISFAEPEAEQETAPTDEIQLHQENDSIHDSTETAPDAMEVDLTVQADEITEQIVEEAAPQSPTSKSVEEFITAEAMEDVEVHTAPAFDAEASEVSVEENLSSIELSFVEAGRSHVAGRRRVSEIPAAVFKNNAPTSTRRQTMFPRVLMGASDDVSAVEKAPEVEQQDEVVADVGVAAIQEEVEAVATEQEVEVIEEEQESEVISSPQSKTPGPIQSIASPVKLAAIDEAQILAVTAGHDEKAVSRTRRRVSLHPSHKSSTSQRAPRRKSMFPSITTVISLPEIVKSASDDDSSESIQPTAEELVEAPKAESVDDEPKTSWTPINKPVSGMRRISTCLASPMPAQKLQGSRRRSMYPAAAAGKLQQPLVISVEVEEIVTITETSEQPKEELVEPETVVSDDNASEAVAQEAAHAVLSLPDEWDIETTESKPLAGTTWYVSVYDKGACVNDLWIPGLEALGAAVNQDWHDITDGINVSHVLFNNGSQRTLQRAADTGAKCVKISYVLDVESAETHLDEDDTKYKIDLMKHIGEPTEEVAEAAALVPAISDIFASAPVLQAPSPATPLLTPNGKENVPMIFLSPDKKTPRAQPSPKLPLGMRTCPPKQLMQPMLDPFAKSPSAPRSARKLKRRLSFDQSANSKRLHSASPQRNLRSRVSAIVEEDVV